MPTQYDFSQRSGVVTGGAQGIGRAVVERLMAGGAAIAIWDRDKPLAEKTAKELASRGKVIAVGVDVTDFPSVERARDETLKAFGKIDILVNNAGIGQGSLRADNWQRPIRFWEVTADEWRRFVAVHTTAPLLLAQAVAPDMMEAKWGRIVNVTTSLGTMIRAGSPTYGPSKAALEAFSAIMAKDLEGSGVTVNVLVPGGVTNTDMVPQESGFDRQQMIQPESMAPPLVWLVSEAASGVSGRRFLAVHWDAALPPAQAAENSGAPIAWTSIATMPIEPGRRN